MNLCESNVQKKPIIDDIPILQKNPQDLPDPIDDLSNETGFDKNYAYFHMMGHEESHSIRRKKILKIHPEIQNLYGKDPISLKVSIACNLILFTMAYYFQNLDWIYFTISSYLFGGSIIHTNFLLIHDLTHNTCFENLYLNKILAVFTNLPLVIPLAISFGRYHYDHHAYMNIYEFDPDIPSQWELQNMNTSFKKFIFLLFQPLFYPLRPLFKMYKIPNQWEIINIITVIVSDIIIYKYIGANGLLWLIIGTLSSMSIHPSAGHIIAEHYEFQKGLESFDYIGPMNFLNLNVGYHTEHHDFPMVPWNRLPMIRKLAPEFYEKLPHHKSYIKVIYRFNKNKKIQKFILSYIFDKNLGPWSRIIRKVNLN